MFVVNAFFATIVVSISSIVACDIFGISTFWYAACPSCVLSNGISWCVAAYLTVQSPRVVACVDLGPVTIATIARLASRSTAVSTLLGIAGDVCAPSIGTRYFSAWIVSCACIGVAMFSFAPRPGMLAALLVIGYFDCFASPSLSTTHSFDLHAIASFIAIAIAIACLASTSAAVAVVVQRLCFLHDYCVAFATPTIRVSRTLIDLAFAPLAVLSTSWCIAKPPRNVASVCCIAATVASYRIFATLCKAYSFGCSVAFHTTIVPLLVQAYVKPISTLPCGRTHGSANANDNANDNATHVAQSTADSTLAIDTSNHAAFTTSALADAAPRLAITDYSIALAPELVTDAIAHASIGAVAIACAFDSIALADALTDATTLTTATADGPVSIVAFVGHARIAVHGSVIVIGSNAAFALASSAAVLSSACYDMANTAAIAVCFRDVPADDAFAIASHVFDSATVGISRVADGSAIAAITVAVVLIVAFVFVIASPVMVLAVVVVAVAVALAVAVIIIIIAFSFQNQIFAARVVVVSVVRCVFAAVHLATIAIVVLNVCLVTVLCVFPATAALAFFIAFASIHITSSFFAPNNTINVVVLAAVFVAPAFPYFQLFTVHWTWPFMSLQVPFSFHFVFLFFLLSQHLFPDCFFHRNVSQSLLFVTALWYR